MLFHRAKRGRGEPGVRPDITALYNCQQIKRLAENFRNFSKGVARKKLRGGPNFATFNVTSFTYNGILPFVNYARRYYKNCSTKLRKCECDFTDLM